MSGAGKRNGLARCASRLISCGCGLVLLVGASALGGLRLNLSGSLPVGLYLIASEPPVRGSIVLACLRLEVAQLAMARGYVPRGDSCPGGTMPIGKPILAVPGDTIVVTRAGLLLNGVAVPNSEPLTVDRVGQPLPRLPMGPRVVAQGEFWLVSDFSPYSFDSRYFGPVSAEEVRIHVRALWTARSPSLNSQ